jgi:protein TonB
MNNRYIEKSFIPVLCISLVLHMGVFAALYFFPQSQPEPLKEAVFIDLQPLPEVTQPIEQRQQETRRRSEQRVRVPRESAPRGDAVRDAETLRKQASAATSSRSAPSVSGQTPIAPGASVSSLLKQKERVAPQSTPLPQLFPDASRLAKLEESYRRAFENDIAEGDTRFLNSDDITFGSFLRRFEGAVYGVWRYPQAAAMKGIEGITPVRITFNRQGEITHIQQLESSGALILDEEVLRTLRAIGPVGGFPKGYDKEEFHLIAFFQYGGSRRSLR